MKVLSPRQLRSLVQLAFRHRGVLRIPSHLTLRERAVLYTLARHTGAGARACEIGSFLGASACALAAGLSDAGSGGRLVCVDTWQNDAMTEGARDTWDSFNANTARYRDTIHPVRGFSHEVAERAGAAAEGPWTLIFFDGDHSTEGARRDWEAFRPRLAPGAVVIFHDIGWAAGVQQLISNTVLPQLIWSRRLPNLFWGELR